MLRSDFLESMQDQTS